MTSPLPHPRSYVCARCGSAFKTDARPTAKWSPKFCGPACRYADHAETHSAKFKADPAFAKKMAKISSERMKRRRNGGDPALNEILAKTSSAHFKKLWANAAWVAAQRDSQLAKAARLNSDPEIVGKKRRAVTWIMKRAAGRMGRNPEWREMMSVKTTEHMTQEPWRQDVHGDYTPDYVSMMCSRVQADPEVAALRNSLMAQYIREEAAIYRRDQGK